MDSTYCALGHKGANPEVFVARETRVCVTARKILSIIIVIYFLTYKNVHQPTGTEQRVSANSEVRRQLQKFGSLLCNLFRITILIATKLFMWLIDFR